MDPIEIVTVVDTWPRAMVACTLVVCVTVIGYLRRTRVEVKETREDVREVRRSLTTNNGDTHVKDSLDSTTSALERIERDVGGMRSELRATNRRLDHFGQRLDHHLDGRNTP